MQKYAKSLIAIVAVVLTGLNMLYGGDPRVQLLISVLAAAGVYQVPNKV